MVIYVKMKSFVLSSGSSANCFYAESLNGVGVLIDCGLSFTKTVEFLVEKRIKLEEIRAVFITHEHSDHILGLKLLFKNLNCNFYLSKGTFDALKYDDLVGNERVKFVKHHDIVKIDDLNIFVVDKPHDSAEAISFVLDDLDKKLGFFTDLGHVTSEIKYLMKTCDILFIETNYCNDILTKNRIDFYGNYVSRLISDLGHLSLQDAVEVLSEVVFDGQKIILSHISENTNSYVNSYEFVKKSLESLNKDVEIDVSFQGESSNWL